LLERESPSTGPEKYLPRSIGNGPGNARLGSLADGGQIADFSTISAFFAGRGANPDISHELSLARRSGRHAVEACQDFCAGLYGDNLSKQKPGGRQPEWGAASCSRNVHEIFRLIL